VLCNLSQGTGDLSRLPLEGGQFRTLREGEYFARSFVMSTSDKNVFAAVSTDESIECPRFDGCSAPICPIDPKWAERGCRKGEAVCFYLRRHAKNALQATNTGSVPEGLAQRVVQAFPKICARYVTIKTSLKRAALSRPKGFSLGEER
jgi:hypothetical protein